MVSLVADDGRTKPKPRSGRSQSADPTEHKCLIRACLGNKKLSTVVSSIQHWTNIIIVIIILLIFNKNSVQKADMS